MIWRRVQRQSPHLFLVLQDLFGSSVFGFVQADNKSNINVRIAFVDHGGYLPTLLGQGVRGRYEANPDDSGTLEALVKHEARDPMITHKHGTACLVRLIRYAEL